MKEFFLGLFLVCLLGGGTGAALGFLLSSRAELVRSEAEQRLMMVRLSGCQSRALGLPARVCPYTDQGWQAELRQAWLEGYGDHGN